MEIEEDELLEHELEDACDCLIVFNIVRYNGVVELEEGEDLLISNC